MKFSTPYLRFINIADHFSNRQDTMAYDCRMLYVLSGTGMLHTDSGDFLLQPDSFAYYPSGIRYLPSSDQDDMQFITVNFDFTSHHTHIKEIQVPVPPESFEPDRQLASQLEIQEVLFTVPFVIESAPFLKHHLLRMHELRRQETLYGDELCSSLLKLCILEILRYQAHVESRNPLVEKIREHIERCYAQISGNDDIAKHFRYHSYYLNHLFRQHTGKTLHQYITEVRLRHSQDLLSHTELSIAAIARDCGFQNSDHFSRLFRKKMGISASAYRKQFRNI